MKVREDEVRQVGVNTKFRAEESFLQPALESISMKEIIEPDASSVNCDWHVFPDLIATAVIVASTHTPKLTPTACLWGPLLLLLNCAGPRIIPSLLGIVAKLVMLVESSPFLVAVVGVHHVYTRENMCHGMREQSRLEARNIPVMLD